MENQVLSRVISNLVSGLPQSQTVLLLLISFSFFLFLSSSWKWNDVSQGFILSFRVFGLLSSSLLLYSQRFGRCVLQSHLTTTVLEIRLLTSISICVHQLELSPNHTNLSIIATLQLSLSAYLSSSDVCFNLQFPTINRILKGNEITCTSYYSTD